MRALTVVEINVKRTRWVWLWWLLTSVSFADSQPSHLKLIDPLDRPSDGYCFDVMGVGENVVLDMPLFAHNCKAGLVADATVIWRSSGQIDFPAYHKCVTVAGVNHGALPGTALMLRDCGDRTPFVNALALQRFEHHADGRIQLSDSNLCVVVGRESSETYSPHDRWRTLSMQPCDHVAAPYARWVLRTP